MTGKLLTGSAISTLLFIVATSASAQTTVATDSPTPDAAEAGPPEQTNVEPATPTSGDVVVTAQRREERLLDVPVSLVATSGDKLQRLNFTQATDLQYITPGLTLGDSNTPRGQGLRVRGIGTTVFADGIEQSVGTVVDGVPLARAGQGLADLVDIERVEVLRGPQGLLFGRNASAGLINIVTRRPSETLSIVANASYGSDNEILLSTGVSGPIVPDRLLARVSAYANKRDGYVDNVRDGRQLNNRKEYGVRGTLEFRATDALEILLRGDWSKRDAACCTWTVRRFASPATDPRPGTLFLRDFTGPLAEGPEARQVASGGAYFNKVESWGGSGEVNLELGDYTLTSLSAYRRWDQSDNNDADLSPSNVLSRNFGSNRVEQTSQELRLTSPANQPVEFVAGLFYFDSRNNSDSQQVGRFALSLTRLQNLGVALPLGPGLSLPPLQLFGRDVNSRIDVEDYAAFGQATVNLSDAFSLIAGGRVTRTKVAIDYARSGTPGASAFNFVLGAAFAPLAFSASTKDTNFSWRLGAQYKLGPDQNVYASVARGYKGPGYNNLLDIVVPANTTARDFSRVNPEIPTAYEIGYKASLLDRTLTVTAALFLTDFKDFQAQVVEFPAGAQIGSFAIRNAGKLRSKGFELSFDARPVPNFSVGMSVAYADARFTRFAAASCPRLGALVTTVGVPCGPTAAGRPNATSFDASGLRVTNAPEWTGTVDARWDVPVSDQFGSFVQANYYWRSDTIYGLYPRNIPNPAIQDGYGILNGSVGVTIDKRLTLAVYARNLLDTNFVNSIFDLPLDSAGGLGQFVTRDAERTIGMQANLRF